MRTKKKISHRHSAIKHEEIKEQSDEAWRDHKFNAAYPLASVLRRHFFLFHHLALRNFFFRCLVRNIAMFLVAV